MIPVTLSALLHNPRAILNCRAHFIAFCFLSHFILGNALAENSPIRFGATLSLTGDSAPFSNACANGIEMAVSDVNSSGGVQGRPLEVLIENIDMTKLSTAASAAQKLASVDKVVALLPNWSEDAEVVAPIAHAHKIISMTLGAGGPGASRFAETSFRATTSDGELAVASVKSEIAQGARRACLLFADTSYYVDISKVLVESWTGLGGEVVYNGTVGYGTGDVAATATTLRGLKCDTIFLWVTPTTIEAMITKLREQSVKARRVLPWFGAEKNVLERTRGDDQTYTVNRWALGDKKFTERYASEHGESAIRPAGNCYDGVRVLASVMNRVGTEVLAVRNALLSLSGYVGVTGAFTITPNRERTGELYNSYVIRNAQLVPID